MKKIKYIYKIGDWTDAYDVGGTTGFKWHKVWKILKVTYDKKSDRTSIKLQQE